MRVGFTLSDSVANGMKSAPFNDPTLWNFAIPFAAASLLVVMLVDTQLAFLTGIVTALFAGMLAPTGTHHGPSHGMSGSAPALVGTAAVPLGGTGLATAMAEPAATPATTATPAATKEV